MDIDTFSDLVTRIYDAAIDFERWDGALALIARTFDSERARVIVSNLELTSLPLMHTSEPKGDVTVTAKYGELTQADPRQSPICFEALHCRQIVSDEALRAGGIYKQALRSAEVGHAVCFSVPLADDVMCFLELTRSPHQAPYSEADCEDFGRLVPHVSRALTLHRALHRYRQEVDTARALMDGIPLGIVVIENNNVVLANKTAWSVIEQGDALHYHNGRLRASTPLADIELRNAVREAYATEEAVGVALPTGESDPLRAVIRQLNPGSAERLGGRHGLVAMYLTDPRKLIETREEVLQRLFGLTPREAAVLRVLALGRDVREIAECLDISSETVRVHLKSAMRTTGVARQADLVRLVLSSPAWVAGVRLGYPASLGGAAARRISTEPRGGAEA